MMKGIFERVRRRARMPRAGHVVSVGFYFKHRDIYTEESRAALANQPRPKKLGGKRVPEVMLNDLTVEQYVKLSGRKIDTDEAAVYACADVLLGLTPADVAALPVDKAFGFTRCVLEDFQRLCKLFAAIKVEHSAEEVQAGVKELGGDAFGPVDYFALRMKITHDEAAASRVLYLYKAMEIDAKNANYQRRLNKIYAEKSKARTKRN